jgi:GPN-loop GTPase
MLHLTRMIDKATGCVFVPPANAQVPEGAINNSSAPPTQRPNAFSLMSSAMGPMSGPRSDVRDVQERWIDAREEYDEWERAVWRKEGLAVQEEARKRNQIRQRGGLSQDGDTPMDTA